MLLVTAHPDDEAMFFTPMALCLCARGVPLHVDGARLWNAVVAQDTTAAALLEAADSATFCLSKGLSCPVGSVVVGSHEFINLARRARKLVGGGMRQVGVLAAPGLVALSDGPEGMIERLADDHVNARNLADGLAGLNGITDLDPGRVTTNYIVFGLRARPGQDGLEARAAINRIEQDLSQAVASSNMPFIASGSTLEFYMFARNPTNDAAIEQVRYSSGSGDLTRNGAKLVGAESIDSFSVTLDPGAADPTVLPDLVEISLTMSSSKNFSEARVYVQGREYEEGGTTWVDTDRGN